MTLKVIRPNGKSCAVAFKLTEGILLVGGPRSRSYSQAQLDRQAHRLHKELVAAGSRPMFAALQLSRLAAALATVSWKEERRHRC
jgi:hypothetical protein